MRLNDFVAVILDHNGPMPRTLFALFILVGCTVWGCSGGLDQRLPGTWKFNIDTSNMQGADKSAADLMQTLYGGMKVELNADRSAVITAGSEVQKGSWSLSENRVTITVGKALPITGVVNSEGTLITPQMDPNQSIGMKGAKLTLKKEK